MAIAHPIAIARIGAGLDTTQLGQAVGAHECEVEGWEAGVMYPEPHVAVRLARLLGMSLHEVYRSLIDADIAAERVRRDRVDLAVAALGKVPA